MRITKPIIYGWHAVLALLNNPYRIVYQIIISERHDHRADTIVALAQKRNILVERLATSVMKQRFPAIVHQGVVAYADAMPEFYENDLPYLLQHSQSLPLIMILDGITDPHNLGACLRTADAAGVDFVIIPKDKSATITPVVSKVACGAIESIPVVYVTNLARSMNTLKQTGIWIYGAAAEAEQSLYQIDCRTALALVMGSEGQGLRRLTRERCDGLFSLPMKGSVESLNVSVATGVSFYEVVRQRLPLFSVIAN